MKSQVFDMVKTLAEELPEKYSDLTQEEVNDLAWLWEKCDEFGELKGRIEQVFSTFMARDGATAIFDKDFTIEDTPTNFSVDVGHLKGIFEYVPQEDLVEDKAFIPEHEETVVVEDKFDFRKLPKWEKFHDDISRIVAESRVARSHRLTVKRKKAKK